MRAAGAASRRKVKTGVSLDPALYEWVHARAGPGRQFSSVTHALECGIVALQEREFHAEARADPEDRRASRGAPQPGGQA